MFYDCNENGCPYRNQLSLECGYHLQDAIFEIDHGEVECGQSFVLGRIQVNTAGLYHAMAKLEFSSLIFFEAEDGNCGEHEIEVDLLFKLIRTCGGVSERIQSWRYLYEIDVKNDINELEVEMSVPFSASFCDRTCADCCEYKIVVEGVDFEGNFDALRVVQPVLSAFVQGLAY